MKPFVITSILAPTDLSESALPALRYARLFADRMAAKLTVFYSDPILYGLDPLGAGTGAYPTTPEDQARLRKEVAAHADPVMHGRPYDIELTAGAPIAGVLSAARERNADFIVMGTHLRRGWRRALLGSVSEGVLHGSDCPVLTVAARDGHAGFAPYAVTNILCPINFTEVARDALHVASRLAERFGARLTVVHVLEPGQVANALIDEESARRWIAPVVQDACSFRELVVRGGPAERVLDCADDAGADLLVVGAQHKLFRDATVIGTTSERLIRFAQCPVLVVPRQAVRREAKRAAAEESGVLVER